jgi:hypothetical protein
VTICVSIEEENMVMLKGDANVESVRAAEVPSAVNSWLVVDDDRVAKWQERGGIVVCV